MKRMTCLIVLFSVCLLCFGQVFASDTGNTKYNAVYGKNTPSITIATGSPGALGLLEELAKPFCAANNCRIKWTKKGSGASLKALKAGRVDMVMVHAPGAEKKAVKEGWAAMRTLLGSNEFYLVGPASDPANIQAAKSAGDAYSRIANKAALFFSRGDNSGTHKKEMRIWKSAGIAPKGAWYQITRDFMGPTLLRADRENGYFMTDSSTYFAKKSKLKNLKILFKGDAIMMNVYHALIASPGQYPEANHKLAGQFVQFVSSSSGQKIFKNYGKKKFGHALYNDADYAKKWDH